MKRRTARKVIKYGMNEVRGRYGTFVKAIQICPRCYNFLQIKRVIKDLRDIYDGAAKPAYQQTKERMFILNTRSETTKAQELLLPQIKGKTLHTKTITYGPKGIGKSRLSSSIWD